MKIWKQIIYFGKHQLKERTGGKTCFLVNLNFMIKKEKPFYYNKMAGLASKSYA